MVYGIGLNYKAHSNESGVSGALKSSRLRANVSNDDSWL